jgi:phosphomevalonate kinase
VKREAILTENSYLKEFKMTSFSETKQEKIKNVKSFNAQKEFTKMQSKKANVSQTQEMIQYLKCWTNKIKVISQLAYNHAKISYKLYNILNNTKLSSTKINQKLSTF